MRQEEGFAVGATDAGVVGIDENHRLGVVGQNLSGRGLRLADQERADAVHGGNIGGVPAVAVEKQVFVPVETQNGDRFEAAVLRLAEEDRIMALDVLIFGREDQGLIDAVAERGAVARDQAQVVMVDIVE